MFVLRGCRGSFVTWSLGCLPTALLRLWTVSLSLGGLERGWRWQGSVLHDLQLQILNSSSAEFPRAV